jgi:hypothetical protein
VLDCPWKKEPWYDPLNSELWLVTNTPTSGGAKACGWPGAAYVLNSNTNDNKLWGCGRPTFVWAKTCTAAQQTVSFTKKIFLPGAPIELEATLQLLKKPLKSMEIDVNGHHLLTASHTVHKVNLKGKAGIFKFGYNEITIHAVKGATKKPCNTDFGDTGFLMELHAKFGADVVATIDPPNNTGTALFIQFVTVKNNGPSATDYGSVSASVSTDHLKPVTPINANAGVVIYSGETALDNCTYFDSSGYSTTCQIPGLLPGQSERYTVKYIYNVPATGNFSDKWNESWGGGGDTFDPNNQNNGGTRPRGACRPPGNPPPCG